MVLRARKVMVPPQPEPPTGAELLPPLGRGQSIGENGRRPSGGVESDGRDVGTRVSPWTTMAMSWQGLVGMALRATARTRTKAPTAVTGLSLVGPVREMGRLPVAP